MTNRAQQAAALRRTTSPAVQPRILDAEESLVSFPAMGNELAAFLRDYAAMLVQQAEAATKTAARIEAHEIACRTGSAGGVRQRLVEPEALWADKAGFAARRNVSKSSVARWIEKGMPHERIGGILRIPIQRAEQWLTENQKGRAKR